MNIAQIMGAPFQRSHNAYGHIGATTDVDSYLEIS